MTSFDAAPLLQPTRRALVIGVNGSARVTTQHALRQAEHDAVAVCAALNAPACGFAATSLIGPAATRTAVEEAIDDLLKDAGPDDEIVLYFSGHGEPIPAKGTVETFLVTADFEPDRAERTGLGLKLSWLYETVYEHPTVGGVLIVLDCCYGGDIVDGDDPLTIQLRAAINAYKQRAGEQATKRYRNRSRAILAAAAPGQKAREGTRFGLLTEGMLQLLHGANADLLGDGTVDYYALIGHVGKCLGGTPMSVTAINRTCLLADHRETVQAARVAPAATRAAERDQRLRALFHDHSGFIAGRLEAFVGREAELADIRDRIATVQATGGYVTVTGHAGQGKSSIIARLLQEFGPDTTAHHFIPLKPGPDHQVGLLRNLLARLIRKHDLSDIYVASDSRPALRDYFVQALREIADRGKQEIIVIDGLDQIEEDVSGERDLSFLPLEPPPGIVFLLGTRPNDTLKPLELRKPYNEYQLPNLSRADFNLILQHRGVTIDPHLTDRFYTAMQQNALYLDLAARELAEPDTPAPEVLITRLADNPDNLFSLSIDRLKRDRQRWRTTLKPILGVLLAARDPLSGRALRTLIAAEDDECREGLQRLGGILARDGEGRYYLYHLKLNDFLRQDAAKPEKEYVFAADEEESSHQKLADWCTGGRGGLMAIWQHVQGDALEQERRAYARRHYIPHLVAARSYDQLWEVIDADAYGRAKRRHDPSMRSYILDLDSARDAVIVAAGGDPTATMAALPRLWRYSLLRCSLSSRVDRLPDPVFPLMTALEQGQEAINLVELLSDDRRKVDGLCAIAVQLYQNADTMEQARSVLARAEYIAQVMSSDEIQCRTLMAVAKTAIALEYPEGAQQLYRTARTVIERIGDSVIQVNLLCALAADQGISDITSTLSLLTNAQRLTEQIKNPAQQSTALSQVASATAQVRAAQQQAAMIEVRDPSRYITMCLDYIDTEIASRGGFDPVQINVLVMLVDIGSHDLTIQDLRRIVQALREVRSPEHQTADWSVLYKAGIVATNDRIRAEWFGLLAEVWFTVNESVRARTVLKDARVAAERIPDAMQQVTTLCMLAEIFYQAGEGSAAQEMLDVIQATAMGIVNTTVRAGALCLIAQTWLKFNARQHAYRMLISARDAALTIADAPARNNICSAIAQGFSQTGSFEEGYALIETIIETSDDAPVLAEAINVFARAGAYIHAQEAMKRVQQRLSVHTQSRTEVQDLRTITRLLADAGAFLHARSIADMIVSPEHRAHALTTIAEALVRSGHTQEARQMITAIRAAAGENIEVQSYSHQLYQVVQALIQAGICDEARIIADHIPQAYERARALRALASSYLQADNGEATRGALTAAMVAAAAVEVLVDRIETFRFLAMAWAEVGIGDMAYSALKSACITAEDIAKAETQVAALITIAQTSTHLGIYTLAYTVLIDAQNAVDRIEAQYERDRLLRKIAREFVCAEATETARSTAALIANPDIYQDTLVDIAVALADYDDFDTACGITETLADPQRRSLALRNIAKAMARSGVYSSASDVAQVIPNRADRDLALRNIVESLAQAGLHAQAMDTAKAIDNIQDQAIARISCAKALAEAGFFEQSVTTVNVAHMLAGTVSDTYARDYTLGKIASILAQFDRFDEAYAVITTITQTETRIRALTPLAHHCIKIARPAQARTILAEALILIEGITHSEERAILLRNIAFILAQADAPDQARNVLSMARQAANALPKAEDRAMALRRLLDIYIDLSSYSEALNFVIEEWRSTTVVNSFWSLLPSNILIETGIHRELRTHLSWVQQVLYH